MKIAVLGMGKIGHNTAAQLVDRGFEVTGFTRDREKADAINSYGITISGALEGNFKVHATTDIAEAVNGAKFLIITTIERKLTDNTTSPRKDRKVNRNCREP